jgi:hypothetical protein
VARNSPFSQSKDEATVKENRPAAFSFKSTLTEVIAKKKSRRTSSLPIFTEKAGT